MATTGSTASATGAIASTTSPSLLSDKKKIVWFYQSNPNPRDKQELEEWKRYSDYENDCIEQAHQMKQQVVQLNGYVINFESWMQSDKNDTEKQRPIERREIDVSQYVREERFSDPVKATTMQSYDMGWNKKNDFSHQWEEQNKQTKADENYTTIAKLAADGILEEGTRLNDAYDAQQMADQLTEAATKSKEELCSCAAQLYSAESFLYRLFTASQRNKDISKVDTLGAFSYLLKRHLHYGKDTGKELLYRGMRLTDGMINEYIQAVGYWIIWPAYISTSKSRRVAEAYGNVLFIIKTADKGTKNRSCISHISHYPEEQEVLLESFIFYGINKMERDPASEKYIISMTAVA